MSRMKKGAKTSLQDFNYYGPFYVGDIVKDLDTQMECEIDSYGRAIDKYGVDHSKGRLSIVRSYDAGNELKAKLGGEEAKESTEATQSSIVEEIVEEVAMTEAKTLKSFTDQQLADELRARGYELSATKIIMVPQEIRI